LRGEDQVKTTGAVGWGPGGMLPHYFRDPNSSSHRPRNLIKASGVSLAWALRKDLNDPTNCGQISA